MSFRFCVFSRCLPLVLFVLSTPVLAQNCSLPDQYNINCDFSGVAPEQAIEELAQVMATAEVDQVVRQAAQQMLPLLNDVTIAANPNAALLAYVALGNSIREDDYWERALAIVVAGQAPAPNDNRDFFEFVGRYMHSQRMAGAYDLSARAAKAVYGSTAQPDGGRQLPGYGPLNVQRHEGHRASIQLIEAWEGSSPLDSELLILQALDGNPEALTIIGEALLSGEGHRAFNHKRIVTRTGRIKGYPYDVAKGIAFLEEASAKGHARADEVLAEHAQQVEAERRAARAEQQRLQTEEREKAEAAAQREADRQIREQAEQDRQNLAGAPGPYFSRDTRLDNLVDAAADTLVREYCQRLKVLPSSGGFLMTGGRIYYANNYCTMKALTGSSNSYYVSRIDILGCTGRRCNVRVTLSCGFKGLLAAEECTDFNRGYFRDGTALIAEDGIGVEAFRIDL